MLLAFHSSLTCSSTPSICWGTKRFCSLIPPSALGVSAQDQLWHGTAVISGADAGKDLWERARRRLIARNPQLTPRPSLSELHCRDACAQPFTKLTCWLAFPAWLWIKSITTDYSGNQSHWLPWLHSGPALLLLFGYNGMGLLSEGLCALLQAHPPLQSSHMATAPWQAWKFWKGKDNWFIGNTTSARSNVGAAGLFQLLRRYIPQGIISVGYPGYYFFFRQDTSSSILLKPSGRFDSLAWISVHCSLLGKLILILMTQRWNQFHYPNWRWSKI